jgi:nitrate/nitrite transport system substrate-binding protein
MANRAEQCQIVSKPTYINCAPEIILGRLMGELDYGDGRKFTDAFPMHFSKRNCNYPQPKHGSWFLSQFRRWGMVTGAPDYAAINKKVLRNDIYEEAMKEIGVTHGGLDNTPETLFDGVVYDPANPEAYAKGFAVKNLKG